VRSETGEPGGIRIVTICPQMNNKIFEKIYLISYSKSLVIVRAEIHLFQRKEEEISN
jgi:hypothetical protein